MSARGPALAVHVRRFAYEAGPSILRDISLELARGSLTAVLGGSGSGTSTFARILAGWALAGGHATFEGQLELGPPPQAAPTAEGLRTQLVFRGEVDDPRLRLGAWGEHVALVPQRAQDLFTGASATVGEELAFTLEQRGVPRARMHALVAEAARAVGLGDGGQSVLHRHPMSLSGGEQRRLALACAIVAGPAVLVLDDPTASLDASGREALARLVETQRSAGTAVVVTAPCADALARSAGHWVLLEGGTAAATGRPEDVLATQAFARSGVLPHDPADADGPALSHLLGDSDAPTPEVSGTRYPIGAALAAPKTLGLGRELAALEAVTFAYRGRRRPVLDHADLGLRAGEVLAITGPNGAGKSTALRHLAGLARPGTGRVRVDGRDIAGLAAGEVAQTVGTLFQDPRDSLFERTALREVAFGLRAGVPRRSRLARDVDARAREALRAVGLAEKADAHPYDLSASGQRLLALAAALARRPRVLLLDEPTVGLDRHGLARLEAVVRGAAEAGAGVVLSTHALAWATRHAHRVVALSDGRFVAV
ncbi:hypothetical protein GCM10027449_32580 [Sinomonas notoginsengisoli]|uniref:ABC transporter ATP-binding protein n=1 Tax=Sinomonas notoginsengisoli TaxID=1457311 RepID=UPI001F490460|nr:ABC transporter ATP-binding protein [Sinomonas notoginsengisoli]